MARSVRWDLVADPRGFTRGFQQANRSADNFGRGMRRTASLIGGAFAGIQVAGFLKDAIAEAREAAQATRQTNAVIKSTGGVAKVSAKDVDRLATALSNKVGIDDEVITAGQNMLLTFKGVRNETGKNNDIFKQATTIAVDMAAKMNQGVVTQQNLEKANIQLGKALNDPIKGISALTRVGVTFNDAQKEQIKTLVESGDTMEAQKIILKELSSEFGGAAEAAADPWQRVTVVFGNIKESIGNVLLPALNSAASFFTDTFIPAVSAWWKTHGPKVKKAFEDIKTEVGEFFTAIRDNLEPQLQRIKDAWDRNDESLRRLIGTFDDGTGSVEAGTDAVKSFGDAMVVIIDTMGKVAAAAKNAEGWINGFNDTLQSVGHWIHARFTVPIIDAFQDVVIAALRANHKMIAGAATVAEALHLPMARGLRKAERQLGEWVNDTNAQFDRIKNEDVVVKLRSTFTPPKGFSMHSIVGAQKGMRIPGYGGGDRVPIMAEAGETVVPKEAARREDFRGWAASMGIPGFQGGGIIPRVQTVSPRGMRGIQEGLDQRVAANTAAGIRRNYKIVLDMLGMGGGPGGWQWQMGVLRNQFPGMPLISGFRPGAITATGNRSYHSMGRAVDIPPVMGYFNFIRANYGRNTRELIFSPAGGRQIHNGQPHVYTGVTRGDHWDHVHWAYDRGGWLPPGLSMAYNGTGRPERVLPPGGGGGAITINVNVPPVANAAEVGRQVVHAIREYELRSGTSWRR